jgi:hypothetical protein
MSWSPWLRRWVVGHRQVIKDAGLHRRNAVAVSQEFVLVGVQSDDAVGLREGL